LSPNDGPFHRRDIWESDHTIGIPGDSKNPESALEGLSLLGPLSIDAYLPTFAVIQRDFQASTADVQLTLTGYLLAFASRPSHSK
jgi:hypothetical protein